MDCLIVLPFFSSIWWMQKIWSVVDLLCQNPLWWSPRISSMYSLNLERGGHSIKFHIKLIAVIFHDNYYSQFYHSFVNWYNNRLLPLIRQYFLIANRINEFMDLRQLCFNSYLNQFCQDLITVMHFIPFQLCSNNFNIKKTRISH
jgi:hypothetical protein